MKPAAWQQFVMDTGPLDPAIVENVLERHGAQAISWTDAGDDPQLEPLRGETPLWRESRVCGLFPADADFERLRRDLIRTFELKELPRHDIAQLEERDWEREWLQHFQPMRFGERLWIRPGTDQPLPAGGVIIELDPGLAFGTGSHATTALCLEWLDAIDLGGKSVLDYGCGSGVLAIAALLLGADSATAVDIDPQALTATRENARRNNVGDRLEVTTDPANIHGSYDVIVANILAGPLIELAKPIGSFGASGCSLALSGILSAQVPEVRAAYADCFRFDQPVIREQDGQSWARLTGQRIEG